MSDTALAEQNTSEVESLSRDPLLRPLTIKRLRLRNRFMSTSHACGLEEGGYPTDRYQAYHEEKARGGIALTMFGGSSNVDRDSPNIFRQLNVGDDGIIPHLQRFSERIHAQGAALMCQITHLGRRGDPYGGDWLPTIGPSAIRETLHRSFPKEMDEHDIARVVKAYGAAALRCKEGGLDGIETLAGGHLIGQFLSPLTNRRTDRFGGSLENRCRFPIMVHQEIRRQVGDDFIVGMRFVVDEGPTGGLTLEECIATAQILQSEGDLDFFNAIYGKMDTELALARDNMPSMGTPLAPWVAAVGAFKREVGVPVFHAARMADVASARHAVGQGHLDMAGMTRAHIADPHIVKKILAGEEDQIRPCVGASHCMSGYRPKCLHNAVTGRETEMSHTIARATAPGRKVVVVGGGPAGLEAARVAAERGHKVVLFEAAAELGGQVLIGSRHSWRRDLRGIIDWRVAQLERLKVDCRTNLYAEMDDVLAEEPDAVIIATGGVPDLDWIVGAELCTSAWDILDGSATAREHVVVFDGTGRHPGPQVAEKVAADGRRVDYFSIDGYLAVELTYAERVTWKKQFYSLGIRPFFDRRLVEVRREGNKLAALFLNDVTLETETVITDQVVVEHGTVPMDEVFKSLTSISTNDGVTDIAALLAGQAQRRQDNPGRFELHRIGDAVASRNIHSAVLDAMRVARAL
ncbi:N-methylproline demethylase [Agaricicola taiwanensis]|uniref:N-methylproline demethylase n=1 Tax=Agaricicola taiwanensis TaxID=591372 RepID=A0A8J2YF65_9RHOB|nr:NADH:flavin oxidoreductase [Agaricicola taiwanensis]GGE28063.1 N-methylproline demethylase [Agaricicola taiwanensis]